VNHAYDEFDSPSGRGGCGCCGGCVSTLVSLLIALIGGVIVLFTSFGPELIRVVGPMLDGPDRVEQAPAPAPKKDKGDRKEGKRGKRR